MEIKSKIVSYVHFDVKLDDKNVIAYKDLYNLFLDDYYEYFPDIFKYPSFKRHSIANIEMKYGHATHIDRSNWKIYLPLFEHFENLGLIKIDRKHYSGAHHYDIYDIEGLERTYNEILSWVEETGENMAAITRDAKLEHLLEGLMGCDIHMYVEKYSAEDYNGPKPIEEHRDDLINDILETKKEEAVKKRWITADFWVYDSKYGLDNNNKYYGRWVIPYLHLIYHDRDYLLFSILAGVRNYGEHIMICEPKGVPEDASYPYLKEVEDWDSDGHSHSYFTLKELQDVDFIELTKDSQYASSEGLKHTLKSIEKLMDDMSKIEKNPEHVRICFFFDN